MHHPTDRRAHTTAFVTPVVEHWLEREILFLVYIIIFNIYIYTNERMFNDTPAQKTTTSDV